MPTVLTITLIVLGATAVLLMRHRKRRKDIYRHISSIRRGIEDRRPIEPRQPPDLDRLRSTFAEERIVRIPNLLAPDDIEELRVEAEASQRLAERSHIPGHKKGGTLSYEAIHRQAPGCLAFYHSDPLRTLLSAIVGEPLHPTADHDQSSCSILYYDRPGDHIGWHFDHNFYRGRHFTVLLSLVNRAKSGGLSAGGLMRRKGDTPPIDCDTSENVLVMFEGARVFHRASPIDAADRRIMLSMTFATDPRVHPVKELARRVKDTAYYGPRALVD